MRFFSFCFVLLFSNFLIAQEDLQLKDIDSTKSREDHIYISITYNILLNRPSGITQNNLPYGLQMGYIRDIPLNKARNFGLGIGLGYAINNYFTNLLAQKTTSGITYEAIPNDLSFRRNKLETHRVELPIEIRWRTSTFETYKFWRIYGGVKLSYIFANASKFVGDNGRFKFTNDDINTFQTDLYLCFGFNTWNFYASYGLSSLYKSGVRTVTDEPVEMRTLKAGLIFYLL